LLADTGVNVVGQALSTRGEQGYVVTDTDSLLTDATLSGLLRSPETLWLRSWRP
jgi:D-3-phosphoglycerate dehydrogenase